MSLPSPSHRGRGGGLDGECRTAGDTTTHNCTFCPSPLSTRAGLTLSPQLTVFPMAVPSGYTYTVPRYSVDSD